MVHVNQTQNKTNMSNRVKKKKIKLDRKENQT